MLESPQRNCRLFAVLVICISYIYLSSVHSEDARMVSERSQTAEELKETDSDCVSEQQQKAPGSPGEAFFRKNHSFDCAKIINGDSAEIAAAREAKRPLTTEYQLWLRLANCSDFFANYAYYPQTPLSQTEAEFPIAYVVALDSDAEQAEALLRSIYAPQNHYCIHVDLKAPKILHDVFDRLAKCLPNVHITTPESVVWGGYSMLGSMLRCLLDLDKMEYPWNYVITLQGHDFPLKTNREIVDILKLYNGANDIQFTTEPRPEYYQWSHQLNYNENGLPVGLSVIEGHKKSQPPANLTIYKSNICAAMSRAFVHFVLTNHVSLALQDWLKDTYIADERLWSTLNHNEFLEAPGGYPGRCVDVRPKQWISRYVVWAGSSEPCRSGEWRNGICLFSVADLAYLTARNRSELFLNKLWMRSDPIAVDCMSEWMFNRTYGQNSNAGGQAWIDLQFYRNLPAVRYQQAKLAAAAGTTLPTNWTC